MAADSSGNIWVANGTGSVSKFDHAGNALSGTAGFTAPGLTAPTAIALDTNDVAWVANSAGTVTKIPASGSGGVTYTGGGTTAASGIAIDAANNVFLVGTGSAKISEFANDGTPLSGAGFPASSGATGIAIDPK